VSMMICMLRSHVVTGAGRGVGRAIADRLLRNGDAVVVLELDPTEVAWIPDHPAGTRITAVIGSASDLATVERAADAAEQTGPLSGWVNNAAVFHDAALHTDSPDDIVGLINANLQPALVGSAVAARRFRAAQTGGAIVNVSSHQVQRAVRGALPYAVAKAAIEGLTKGAAVDYDARWPRSTRSAASGSPRKWLTPSPTCCPMPIPSSAEPWSPSTADEQPAAKTRKRGRQIRPMPSA